MEEELCSIYISVILMPKEEEEYFKLLSEYRDVFVWIYKEMLELNTKVAAHNLSIKKGISPKKKPQRRFILG